VRLRNGRLFAGAAALAVAALAMACGRDEITHVRVAKQAPPPASAAAIPADLAAPAAPAGGRLAWTLPAGWTQGAGGAMRFATLRPPVVGRVDASVVVLPGPAGGELANVNRWRGQIGLPPLDEAALAAARRVVRTKAGPFGVYDFSSDGPPPSRLVAGLALVRGNTWFVKMTGDAAAVGAARDDFMKLVGSLRFDAR
jgi:hypothetical protein